MASTGSAVVLGIKRRGPSTLALTFPTQRLQKSFGRQVARIAFWDQDPVSPTVRRANGVARAADPRNKTARVYDHSKAFNPMRRSPRSQNPGASPVQLGARHLGVGRRGGGRRFRRATTCCVGGNTYVGG